MSGKKQFYYMGDKGNEVLRIKQILTLHHVAKNLKYDSDACFLVQNYLLKIKEPSISYDLKRVIQLRKSVGD